MCEMGKKGKGGKGKLLKDQEKKIVVPFAVSSDFYSSKKVQQTKLVFFIELNIKKIDEMHGSVSL